MNLEKKLLRISISLILICISKSCLFAETETVFKNPNHQIIKREGNKQQYQPPKRNCVLPQHSESLTYIVDCPENTVKCSYEAGSEVPDSTVLQLTCADGFTTDIGSDFEARCQNGYWSNTLECRRACPPIKYQNMDITCYIMFKGPVIPCNRTGPIFPGVIVIPKCKPQYRQEPEVGYTFIVCSSSGEWDELIFKCVPACGKLPGNVSPQPLISGGKPENRRESPWQVAIYDISYKIPLLICGGTIISSQLIVSAAQCFFNFDENKFNTPLNYEIAVAKVSQNYTRIDTSETRIFKIQQIFTPRHLIEFTGHSTNYAGDIALLQTKEPILFSRGVLPACLDWTDTNRFVAEENAFGKLVGWGEIEEKKRSQILMGALLPYVSWTSCRQMIQEDLANYIATDKFCAGSIKKAGAAVGDAGAGLIFRKTDGELHYIRGVVSNKAASSSGNETSIAIFTDVAQYASWIHDKRVEIETEQRKKAETKKKTT